MDAVHIVSGTAVPLDRSDVDTDQIIPSDWLKQVSRTGFEKGLFSEWRDDRDFVLNQEQFQGANILIVPGLGDDVRVGGDVKIGLGSNLTLDATVNTDFVVSMTVTNNGQSPASAVTPSLSVTGSATRAGGRSGSPVRCRTPATASPFERTGLNVS